MSLFAYAKALVDRSGKTLRSGEVFAKVLTPNDDSGRHGVLIPTDAYAFFPNIPVTDPAVNATEHFQAFDCLRSVWTTVAFKYYQRYPERRITRVNTAINDLTENQRLFIAVHAKHSDGSLGYYFDVANSKDGRFTELFRLIFGEEVAPLPGNFVLRPTDAPAFSTDHILDEFLDKFDTVKSQGWIDGMRAGDTGIGYTFETLVGIKENNDQIADFKGIEIKCQGIKEGRDGSSSKINLFQAGPEWVASGTSKERIRVLGRAGADGLYACYSQVSTATNNLGLLLQVFSENSRVDLKKDENAIGFWPFSKLQSRLAEKHSRAAFVKARIRNNRGVTQFWYDQVVYCERPSLDRFIELVDRRNIVFEFTMSEKSDGSVRNHGYPWRLSRAEFLDQLFAFQVKLR